MTTTVLRSVALAVDSVERAQELFSGLLGGVPGDGSVRFPPGVDLELWEGAGKGLRQLTFAVDDPEKTRDALVELGFREAGDGRLEAPPGYGGAVALVDKQPDEVGAGDAGPDGRPIVRSFDHVCAPAAGVERSFAIYAGALAGDLVFGGDNDVMGTRSGQVRFAPGTKVELLHAKRPGVPVGEFAARFPDRFHHLTMVTGDLPGLIAKLEEAGYPLVDTDLDSRPTWHETFIRPSATFGALLQLVDTPLEYKEPLADDVIDDILSGRLTSYSYQMQRRPSEVSTGRLVE
jgi:catechol 2,3-dioxygenase-like lactoylglutathione lyase family enzyme